MSGEAPAFQPAQQAVQLESHCADTLHLHNSSSFVPSPLSSPELLLLLLVDSSGLGLPRSRGAESKAFAQERVGLHRGRAVTSIHVLHVGIFRYLPF